MTEQPKDSLKILEDFLASEFYRDYKREYLNGVMDDCQDEEVILELFDELRIGLIAQGQTTYERGPKQVRRFEVEDNKVIWREVAEGTLWTSGWDERVYDDTTEFAKTAEDGVYLMSFIPVGEDLGMDSYEDVKFTRDRR